MIYEGKSHLNNAVLARKLDWCSLFIRVHLNSTHHTDLISYSEIPKNKLAQNVSPFERTVKNRLFSHEQQQNCYILL